MRAGGRRPSPALVISVLALFVALGGTAIAVKKAPKNSVFSSSIKNKQVKSADISNKKGVKTKDIVDGEVGSSDIGDGAVSSAKIGAGAVPRAYALVVPGGVDEARSKGVDDGDVSLESGSFLCFNGLDFQPKHVQVTTLRVGGLETSFPNASTGDFFNNAFCAGQEQALVQFSTSGGLADATPPRFYVAFVD